MYNSNDINTILIQIIRVNGTSEIFLEKAGQCSRMAPGQGSSGQGSLQ